MRRPAFRRMGLDFASVCSRLTMRLFFDLSINYRDHFKFKVGMLGKVPNVGAMDDRLDQ